jgi:PleD family two-component response regulator
VQHISNKPNLLIIEDNQVEAKVLRLALKDKFDVKCVFHADQAKQYLASKNVDLILLDVNMPDMDGIALCREIKLIKSLQQIPIVFLTGTSRESSEEQCWAAGCADFLIKPVSHRNLLLRLQLHLAMKQRAINYQNKTKWYHSKKHTHSDWYLNFLDEQCHKANMGHTPMSLVLIQMTNFAYTAAIQNDDVTDEYLTKISRLIADSMNRSIDLVVRYKKDRFLCILPDSGPEQTRHFTFLVSQAISKFNSLWSGYHTIKVELNMVAVTRFKSQNQGKALLKEMEARLQDKSSDEVEPGIIAFRRKTELGGFEQTLVCRAM